MQECHVVWRGIVHCVILAVALLQSVLLDSHDIFAAPVSVTSQLLHDTHLVKCGRALGKRVERRRSGREEADILHQFGTWRDLVVLLEMRYGRLIHKVWPKIHLIPLSASLIVYSLGLFFSVRCIILFFLFFVIFFVFRLFISFFLRTSTSLFFVLVFSLYIFLHQTILSNLFFSTRLLSFNVHIPPPIIRTLRVFFFSISARFLPGTTPDLVLLGSRGIGDAVHC